LATSMSPAKIAKMVELLEMPSGTSTDLGPKTGARFTKYLTTILRLSYDNAKIAIDLRRPSNLPNILQRIQGFSWVRFTCKIVRSTEIVIAKLAQDIPKVTIVSRSYDKLKIKMTSYRLGSGETICPPPMAVRLAADLRPSADGSAVRTWLSCRQPVCL